jgi:hypothetical protein
MRRTDLIFCCVLRTLVLVLDEQYYDDGMCPTKTQNTTIHIVHITLPIPLRLTMPTPTNLIPIITDIKELASYGVLRVKLPSTLDCGKWARELSTVTPQIMAGEGDGEYAFYRNILDEPDFPFSTILTGSDIGNRIVQHFNITSLSEIRLDDAFCVHYNMTQDDTSGAKHVDPSDITVNMCLEKTDDVKDSHVLFYGTQALEGVPQNGETEPSFQFMVEQVPGYATIHWGHHPHETMPMTGGGKRTNIVLTYCYCDSSRSNVGSRLCYG